MVSLTNWAKNKNTHFRNAASDASFTPIQSYNTSQNYFIETSLTRTKNNFSTTDQSIFFSYINFFDSIISNKQKIDVDFSIYTEQKISVYNRNEQIDFKKYLCYRSRISIKYIFV